MILGRFVLAGVLVFAACPVLAQSARWTSNTAPDGNKFGVNFENNYSTFYVVCQGGSVEVNIETTGQEGSRQQAVVTINGQAFRLNGTVDPGPDGEWLNAKLVNPGPFLEAMRSARSVSVQSASGRVSLPTAGMTAAIQRGLARCR